MSLHRCSEPYDHWVWEAPGTGDLLRLVPERGGLVTGWRCGGREVLYFDAARFADPALSVRGGIPVLFPICGNLPEDRLTLPQGTFSLPQHGFARDRPWTLTALEDGAGVRLELQDDATTRACYPFAFRLGMELRPEPGALAIQVQVEHCPGADGSTANDESGLMPFSFGLHPYLAVADPAAVRLEGLADTCLDPPTRAPAPTAGLLQRLAGGVDLLSPAAGPVRLLDPQAGLAVSLETTAPFDQVVVWTDPPRPMVCVEPWTAPRGSLVSGERRLELAPGSSLTLECRYVLSQL
ncbi:MAG: galactose mutarotase [Cyanobacteriota bacterium]